MTRRIVRAGVEKCALLHADWTLIHQIGPLPLVNILGMVRRPADVGPELGDHGAEAWCVLGRQLHADGAAHALHGRANVDVIDGQRPTGGVFQRTGRQEGGAIGLIADGPGGGGGGEDLVGVGGRFAQIAVRRCGAHGQGPRFTRGLRNRRPRRQDRYCPRRSPTPPVHAQLPIVMPPSCLGRGDLETGLDNFRTSGLQNHKINLTIEILNV